jgi:serine/threonine protein phosphatase PrpC
MVPDDELLRWGLQGSPSVAAWNLVELANQYGGTDNITVLILAVQDVRPWPEEGSAELGARGSELEEGAGSGPMTCAEGTPPSHSELRPPSSEPRAKRAWLRGLFGRA